MFHGPYTQKEIEPPRWNDLSFACQTTVTFWYHCFSVLTTKRHLKELSIEKVILPFFPMTITLKEKSLAKDGKTSFSWNTNPFSHPIWHHNFLMIQLVNDNRVSVQVFRKFLTQTEMSKTFWRTWNIFKKYLNIKCRSPFEFEAYDKFYVYVF